MKNFEEHVKQSCRIIAVYTLVTIDKHEQTNQWTCSKPSLSESMKQRRYKDYPYLQKQKPCNLYNPPNPPKLANQKFQILLKSPQPPNPENKRLAFVAFEVVASDPRNEEGASKAMPRGQVLVHPSLRERILDERDEPSEWGSSGTKGIGFGLVLRGASKGSKSGF